MLVFVANDLLESASRAPHPRATCVGTLSRHLGVYLFLTGRGSSLAGEK
jgi:hypothetical protein